MGPSTIRVPSPIQKHTKNPRLPRASTFPIADKQVRVPRLNLPSHLNLFTNQSLQPSTPMSNFASATAGMSFAGPSLSFPSLLPSPTSPNAGSAALSLLLPPTPPPPMSDLPFSPLNSAGLRRNELQLPCSPLHHNYPLESDLNSLLRALTPPDNPQQLPNADLSNLSQPDSGIYSSEPLASTPTAHGFVHPNTVYSNILPENSMTVSVTDGGDSDAPFSSGATMPVQMSTPFPLSTSAPLPSSFSIPLPALSFLTPPITSPPALTCTVPLNTANTTSGLPSAISPIYSGPSSHQVRSSNNLPTNEGTYLQPRLVPPEFLTGDARTGSVREIQSQRRNENSLRKVSGLHQVQNRATAQELSSTGQPPRRVRGRRSSPNSTLVCPECNQLYSRRDNLRAHLRGIHHGDKPYKCNNCGERFRWASTLRSHEATNKCRRDGATPRRRGRARGTSFTPSPVQASAPMPSSKYPTTIPIPTINEQTFAETNGEPMSEVQEIPSQTGHLSDVGMNHNYLAWQESGTAGQSNMKSPNTVHPSTGLIDYSGQNVATTQPETSDALVLSAPWNELGL